MSPWRKKCCRPGQDRRNGRRDGANTSDETDETHETTRMEADGEYRCLKSAGHWAEA